MHPLLLLVEDETFKDKSLFASLADKGYSVVMAHTLPNARREMATKWPDLVVLNLTDGQIEAAEMARYLQAPETDIPTLAVVDGPVASKMPAGKFPLQFCTAQKLAEQIARLLPPDRPIRRGSFLFDPVQHTLARGNKVHHLTPKLATLFNLLLVNHGQIVYRKTIMQEVWETDYMGDTRTLDVHIRWLREAIEDNPSRPKYLLTVRGAGYRFIVNPDL